LVERVRFSKCVIWRVSAVQYKLLIDYGEQKLENKRIAAAKRYPVENRKPKPALRKSVQHKTPWGKCNLLTGKPGETVSRASV